RGECGVSGCDSYDARRQAALALHARMRALVIACCIGLASAAATAQDLAPDALVRSISEDLRAAIRQDKAIQAGDTRKLAALVEARVMPHFDFRRTTQIALG